MMQSYIIFFVFQIKYVLLHMIGNNENDKTYICMKVKFYIVFYISSLILYSLILKK